MKKIIILIAALAAVGFGIGYYLYNKPVASLENKKADVEISAAELIEAYEADEQKANDTYLGKIVQVSGKVDNVAVEEGTIKVILGTGNPMSTIICELEAGKETGPIQPGDEVKVKGLCSGYLSDVVLVQSSIVK